MRRRYEVHTTYLVRETEGKGLARHPLVSRGRTGTPCCRPQLNALGSSRPQTLSSNPARLHIRWNRGLREAALQASEVAVTITGTLQYVSRSQYQPPNATPKSFIKGQEVQNTENQTQTPLRQFEYCGGESPRLQGWTSLGAQPDCPRGFQSATWPL